jgi:hypothetical protein
MFALLVYIDSISSVSGPQFLDLKESAMKTFARSLFAVVFLLSAYVASTSRAADTPAMDAKAAFAKLKTLAGEWKAASPGKPDGKIIYKVTANGNTVMETMFPGTDHEMVSMYFIDGDQLVMTHYCAMGNQPRLKFDMKSSKPDSLLFVFDGGTNLDPKKDMHIHGLRLNILDKGHVEANWESYEEGKSQGGMKFDMSKP